MLDTEIVSKIKVCIINYTTTTKRKCYSEVEKFESKILACL